MQDVTVIGYEPDSYGQPDFSKGLNTQEVRAEECTTTSIKDAIASTGWQRDFVALADVPEEFRSCKTGEELENAVRQAYKNWKPSMTVPLLDNIDNIDSTSMKLAQEKLGTGSLFVLVKRSRSKNFLVKQRSSSLGEEYKCDLGLAAVLYAKILERKGEAGTAKNLELEMKQIRLKRKESSQDVAEMLQERITAYTTLGVVSALLASLALALVSAEKGRQELAQIRAFSSVAYVAGALVFGLNVFGLMNLMLQEHTVRHKLSDDLVEGAYAYWKHKQLLRQVSVRGITWSLPLLLMSFAANCLSSDEIAAEDWFLGCLFACICGAAVWALVTNEGAYEHLDA